MQRLVTDYITSRLSPNQIRPLCRAGWPSCFLYFRLGSCDRLLAHRTTLVEHELVWVIDFRRHLPDEFEEIITEVVVLVRYKTDD